MRKLLPALSGVALFATSQSLSAQVMAPSLAGTRLDINAVGEVTRVPDIAIISAGVVTQGTSASAAMSENAARMERVRAALKRAGIADRDLQTSSINLSPQYRYGENQPPVLTGYQASNQLSVRFRDIRSSGRILDALVAEGANQINGPTLTIDQPGTALDEARSKAVAAGRARAALYARSLGMRVVKLISVVESGGDAVPPPAPVMFRAQMTEAKTPVDPGEQKLQVNVAMSFELQ